jgi:hypothetical protein
MTPAEMLEAADSRVAQEIAPYLDQTIWPCTTDTRSTPG